MPSRYLYVCCFKDTCISPVVRIDRHLTEVHALVPKTSGYLAAHSKCSRISNPNYVLTSISEADEATKDTTTQQDLTGSTSSAPPSADDDTYVRRFIQRLVYLSDDNERNPKPIKCTESNLKNVLNALRDIQRREGNTSQTLLDGPLAFINKRVIESWVETNVKSRNPGTLNARVFTLKKFIQFVVREDSVSTNLLSRLNACLPELKDASARLSRLAKRRRFLNESRDRGRLLGKEHFKLFLESDYVKRTLVQLGATGGPGDLPTIQFAVQSRNVLLTLLLLRSVQRSGALAGLTLDEFRNGETTKTETDGERMIVLSVTHHKTFHVYGSARLSLEPWLHELLENYATHLRPLSRNYDAATMDQGDSPFFLTTNSSPLENGYTSRAIVSAWRRARVPKDFVSITNFRKSVVSILHGEKPEARGDLSSLMSHRLSTSEAFYKNTCMPLTKAATTATMVRDCVAGRDNFSPVETVPQDPEKEPDLPETFVKMGRPSAIEPADATRILDNPDVQLMLRNKRSNLPKLRELCRTDVTLAEMAAKYTVARIHRNLRYQIECLKK